MPHCGISRAGGCDVVALSRRKPRDLHGARHVPIDPTDAAQCTQAATALRDTTHLVYAALYEAPNLVDSWRDLDQRFDATQPAAPKLHRVALARRLMASTSVRLTCMTPGKSAPVVAGAGISEMDRAVERVALQARSNLAGAGSVRRHVIPVCRLQHVALPDPAGAAFDRFDGEDQPGQAGFTGRRTPSPLPCAS
jgi:hypothetical protein